MIVKCLIIICFLTFFRVELVWLVYNCILFIMFIYRDYSSSEYTEIDVKLNINKWKNQSLILYII